MSNNPIFYSTVYKDILEQERQNRIWSSLDNSCRGKFLDKLIKAQEDGFDQAIFQFRGSKFLYELSKNSSIWKLMGILPL